jgi:hypothetical protein
MVLTNKACAALFEGRKQLLDFKTKFNILHDYQKLYVKVVNERKLARDRQKRQQAMFDT